MAVPLSLRRTGRLATRPVWGSCRKAWRPASPRDYAKWSALRYALLAARRTDQMPTKRHKPEEIVAKLRQVDVLTSQGQSVADAIRSIGVTEVTYYRWRQEFGGLKIGRASCRERA